MLLSNGSAIKQDVIDSFNTAIANSDNWNEDGSMNWNFVDADMHIDLSAFYATSYIDECFDALATAEEWV